MDLGAVRLQELLCEAADQAMFTIQERERYSARQLQRMYHETTERDQVQVCNATPEVEGDQLTQLTSLLHTVLGQYILDDRIGHTLHGVISSAGFPVTSFALDLVRAAAILGP